MFDLVGRAAAQTLTHRTRKRLAERNQGRSRGRHAQRSPIRGAHEPPKVIERSPDERLTMSAASTQGYGLTQIPHSAPKIRHGPNGMNVLRPIRPAASSSASTRPAASNPASSPPGNRNNPTISPTPTSSFTSPIPNAPAPNGIDSR